MKNDRNSGKIVLFAMGVIFLITGVGLGVFAVHTINDYNEKNKTYTETTSKVVNYQYDSDHKARAIVVEYEVNGTTYQKTSNVYTSHPKSLGTEVKIKYNPSNPKEMIWSNDSTNIILPIVSIVFALIGIGLIIGGIVAPKDSKTLIDDNKKDGLYTSPELEKIKEENQDILNDTDNNTVN